MRWILYLELHKSINAPASSSLDGGIRVSQRSPALGSCLLWLSPSAIAHDVAGSETSASTLATALLLRGPRARGPGVRRGEAQSRRLWRLRLEGRRKAPPSREREPGGRALARRPPARARRPRRPRRGLAALARAPSRAPSQGGAGRPRGEGAPRRAGQARRLWPGEPGWRARGRRGAARPAAPRRLLARRGRKAARSALNDA